MTIRRAKRSDADAIAHLHTTSWRSAYRGILRDDFLDGALDANRHALWNSRLDDSPEDQFILVDEHAGKIRGFACTFFDAEGQWGSLLDNLHVIPDLKGQGLGRQLMAATAAGVVKYAARPVLHLWAYEQNLAARRFYDRLGGVVTECTEEPALDGTRQNVVRYFWADLSQLGVMDDAAR
jgi:GNAT superfamily N-acetyltransferase